MGGCVPPIVPSFAVPLLPSGHQPAKAACLALSALADGHLGLLDRQDGEPVDLDGLDLPLPDTGPHAGLALVDAGVAGGSEVPGLVSLNLLLGFSTDCCSSK